MDSGGSSYRRLSFDDVSEDHHSDDISNDNNTTELVNSIDMNTEIEIPKIGMSFDTEDDAYNFYLKYAKRVGFGIRRSKVHKNDSGELVDRIFCCSAEGKKRPDKRDIYVQKPRPETRLGCQARLKISRRFTEKLCVVNFIEEHNHYLSSPNKVHLHRSHRQITESEALQIQMANDVGIAPKASHDLMARQVGGRENLGFIPQDYKNYLRFKRTRATTIGDTGGVLEYLQKMQFDDPNFFYAIQVDEDDLITNIFWCDARMRSDYSHFGDVICFDTTYRKNEGRPIALFVGVNHHKQSVIFGAALLYDETSLSFEWLFDTFTTAMCGKKPITILTDQDAAMAKALASTWPGTYHRLCLWHIFQNAAKHLSCIFSKFKEFTKDFGACIYEFDEEVEFIAAWDSMLNKYGLVDNDWLRRMFNLKEKWALVYGRHVFCADMSTTQRSESVNSIVKRYVNYKHKFLDFFNHFQRLLEDRRYQEIVADFKANTSIPSLVYPVEILKHASSIYTPAVYKYFEQEWYKSHDSSLECFDEGELILQYKITPHNKSYHHVVTFDSSSEQTYCSCRKFEFAGILCSHILKVFMMKNIKQISARYILKRWTRQAKVGFVEDSNINKCNLDPKLLQNVRYKELCSLYLQLVTKASENDDDYKMVKDSILKLFEMVDNKSSNKQDCLLQGEEFDKHGAKGIKYKNKTTSGKRLKGGLEKTARKKRGGKEKGQSSTIAPTPPTLQSSHFESSQEIGSRSSEQSFGGFSTSMSMTSLLMAQQPLNFGSIGNDGSHGEANVDDAN